jgi:hypothetical protein
VAVQETLATARWVFAHHPARLIYGNDAWGANNRGQRQLLRRLRRDSEVRPADPAERWARQLENLGYALLDPGYPDGLVASVRQAYGRVIDDPDATVDMGRRIPTVVRYVKEPLGRVPVLRELLTAPVRDILDARYGGRWRIEHVRMWRIGHIPVAEQPFHHYGNLWHCDQHPTSTLKLFVQLSDGVTAEGGAFRFHDIPSTRQIMRSGFLGRGQVRGPARRMIEDPERVRYFDTPAGTVALCNTTRCVHRAGIPPEGATRGMVQFTFAPTVAGTRPVDLFDIPPDENVAPGRYA